MKTKIRYECKQCGSDKLWFTYDARWDVDSQRMKVQDAPVVVFCDDCDDEADYREIHTCQD